MAITDIFNTSFFILLGICFIVIGLVGYYFSQIILQQNKKISGMVDLISTMAQEMEFIRSKTLQMNANTIVPQFFTGGSSVAGISSGVEKEIKNNLIPVSDDEDDDDEDDDDDNYDNECDE